MKGALDRLGDRINPVVVKETRQAVNSRLVAGALLLFLTGQFVALAVMATRWEATANPDDLNLRAGRDVFLMVQGILLGTCMLLVPALTGGRLAGERSDTNVDLLFISSLSPRAIVGGKLLAAAALVLLMFSACAPFMAFAYLLRGLDVPTILVVLAIDFVAVLAGTMFALLIAAFPVNRGFRVVLSLGGFVVLAYAFFGAIAATSEILRYGLGIDLESAEFWAGFAGLAGLILGVTGLMFVWATALVTPPTANRAFLVRVYTLVFWLATGAGCVVWSRHNAHPGPVFAWGFVGVALAVLQIVTAISEREHLGPRVARRIPRNLLLRAPAFVLFSGAAGGLVFAVGLGVLSVAGMWVWLKSVWTPPGGVTIGDLWQPTRIACLVFGYAYCYGMTAVLVRRVAGTSAGYRVEYTWVVGLILFGLGSVMPFIVEATFYSRQYQGLYRDEQLWLHLPNPFVIVDKATDSSMGDQVFALGGLVLAAWALVATAFNARWLVRQAAAFRPPGR